MRLNEPAALPQPVRILNGRLGLRRVLKKPRTVISSEARNPSSKKTSKRGISPRQKRAEGQRFSSLRSSK
jgi:hypothetical protein